MKSTAASFEFVDGVRRWKVRFFDRTPQRYGTAWNVAIELSRPDGEFLEVWRTVRPERCNPCQTHAREFVEKAREWLRKQQNQKGKEPANGNV